MQTLAEEALADAGGLAGPSSAIEYAVACGSSDREAVVQAATGTGADLIVVPREPAGRFRHLFSASLAEQLRRDGRWPVVTPRSS